MRFGTLLIAMTILQVGLPGALPGGSALAADRNTDPFSALTGKRSRSAADIADAATVQRFVTATNERVFLLEVAGDQARIKFMCGPHHKGVDCAIDDEFPAEEIYRLSATPAARGDTIYKDETGRTVLRVTAYGGPTVFWPGEKSGVAASKSFGNDAALELLPLTIEAAEARAAKATALVSASLGTPVIFDIAGGVIDERLGAAVLGDAVARTAKGIEEAKARLANRDEKQDRKEAGNAFVVRSVRFEPADAPAVRFEGGKLTIDYAAGRGVNGRPSSLAIANALLGAGS